MNALGIAHEVLLVRPRKLRVRSIDASVTFVMKLAILSATALPTKTSISKVDSPFVPAPVQTGRCATSGTPADATPVETVQTVTSTSAPSAIETTRPQTTSHSSLIPDKAATPLKPDAFIRLLAAHPDPALGPRLADIIVHGANILSDIPHYPRFTPNSLSATQHADVLRSAIQKEVQKGHTIGPFNSPPFPDFVCSALGVVAKKDGGHRVILDLSRPAGDSVNDYIDPEGISLEYCSVDDATRLLQEAGKGALMGKQDIESAFRLIPVRKADWHKLGFQFEGRYYCDVVLPFGCRSSPFLFCLFSDAIHWIIEQKANLKSLLHYMDDYLFIGKKSTGECQLLMDMSSETCAETGVPLKKSKSEGPSPTMVFLGVLLDSIRQTLSLPPGKLAEIVSLIKSWLLRTTCSRTELQSLIGSLMFAAKCVPAGRLFTRRMLLLLKEPEAGGPTRPARNFKVVVSDIQQCQKIDPRLTRDFQRQQLQGPTLGSPQGPTNLANPTFSTNRDLLSNQCFSSNPTRTSGSEPSVLGSLQNPMFSSKTHLIRKPSSSWSQNFRNGAATLNWEGPRSRRTQKSIVLDDNFRLDLEWWNTFLPLWNGSASFLEVGWSKPDTLHLYTDASATLGLGAFFQGEWFQSRWPDWVLREKPAIEYLEMVPILLAVIVWGEKLFRKKVMFQCDNEGATLAWEKLGSCNKGVLDLMRRIMSEAAKGNFNVAIKHIRGVDNSIADALSRFQEHRFRKMAPDAMEKPTSFPNLFDELHKTFL